MMWPFAKPKPTPPGVIIRNRLGEEIDRVEAWTLEHKDLRLKDWRHRTCWARILEELRFDTASLLDVRCRTPMLAAATFLLATGIPAGVQMKQRCELEERTAAGVHTLRSA